MCPISGKVYRVFWNGCGAVTIVSGPRYNKVILKSEEVLCGLRCQNRKPMRREKKQSTP